MDLGRDLFESVMRDLTAEQAQANRVQEEIQNAAIEVCSEDGLIRLTVGPPGQVRSLQLDPRVKRIDVETLGETIVEMVNRASALLQEEITNRIQGLLPQIDTAGMIAEYMELNRLPE